MCVIRWKSFPLGMLYSSTSLTIISQSQKANHQTTDSILFRMDLSVASLLTSRLPYRWPLIFPRRSAFRTQQIPFSAGIITIGRRRSIRTLDLHPSYPALFSLPKPSITGCGCPARMASGLSVAPLPSKTGLACVRSPFVERCPIPTTETTTSFHRRLTARISI